MVVVSYFNVVVWLPPSPPLVVPSDVVFSVSTPGVVSLLLPVGSIVVVVSLEAAPVVTVVVVEEVVEVVVVVEVVEVVVVELSDEVEFSTFVEFSNKADVDVGVGVVDVSTTEVVDNVASVVIIVSSSSSPESNRTSLC